MARARSKVVSIQEAREHRGYKTREAWLQGETLKQASNHGLTWDDDDVSRLVQEIERDETTYELALALGRSYYSMMGARAHVAFALRHETAIWGRKSK